MDYDDKLEKLVCLSIGRIRELLAFANGEETLDSWLEDVCDGILTDTMEEEDYEDIWEDDDCEADEDDSDDLVVTGGYELNDTALEDLAQEIADDILNGEYDMDSIPEDIYSHEVIDRIRYLID